MFFGLLGNKEAPATQTATQTEETKNQSSNEQNVEDKVKDSTSKESPLDSFKTLWQPDKEETIQPGFAVDQSKLMEVAGKLDFTKLIKPEQIQAIANGGEEAAKAFLEAINAVSQASFANTLAVSAKLTEQALAAKEVEFETRLPGAIKSFNIDSSISQDPVLNHPAAKPVIGAIAKQIARQYPDASVKEVQEQALKLLREISKVGEQPTGTATKRNEDEVAGDFDWDKWANT